jgi:hypothetical protein
MRGILVICIGMGAWSVERGWPWSVDGRLRHVEVSLPPKDKLEALCQLELDGQSPGKRRPQRQLFPVAVQSSIM